MLGAPATSATEVKTFGGRQFSLTTCTMPDVIDERALMSTEATTTEGAPVTLPTMGPERPASGWRRRMNAASVTTAMRCSTV